jgi:DNA-binding Lrp family transcriptional regulator
VRILQHDFPLLPRPFDSLSRNSGLPAEEIINTAKSMLRSGVMRRFGAGVQTRRPGFVASTMGVWVVPEDRADEYGALMAQNKAVSHCYLRPVYEDWPYNLFTTIHGRSVDECESVINDLAADTGLDDRRSLYPTREFKKARISYFSLEADEWESARVDSRAAAAS